MDKAVQTRFNDYPAAVQLLLENLRALIYQIAEEYALGEVEETLKWGEPSYTVTAGSPVRIDWKLKTPHHYYLFFNCQTKLVDTFRELYGESLVFQGNRAIVLSLSEPLPEQAIRHCLQLAMTYHKIKHQPLLGASPSTAA
ncbi:DUF1801 domain-containing protein [Photobacterium sp. TY1-4]|uniref:DUF1801 domain-containing protein n=1 Tax=Photobacterium sp. TY1-4 TaxID=2899122 RepID=UPI0021C01D34|nr:DUF1801 domain-containing protein [Photobacterium sp. TY1-4]UXI00084.1 DUF1801 domain-containing protein [Photobacterium sp. TY1-4]